MADLLTEFTAIAHATDEADLDRQAADARSRYAAKHGLHIDDVQMRVTIGINRPGRITALINFDRPE